MHTHACVGVKTHACTPLWDCIHVCACMCTCHGYTRRVMNTCLAVLDFHTGKYALVNPREQHTGAATSGETRTPEATRAHRFALPPRVSLTWIPAHRLAQLSSSTTETERHGATFARWGACHPRHVGLSRGHECAARSCSLRWRWTAGRAEVLAVTDVR